MLTNKLPETSKNAPNAAKTEEEEILSSNTVPFPAKNLGCWQHTGEIKQNTRKTDNWKRNKTVIHTY